MPNVTAPARVMQDGQVITEFTDVASVNSVTFSYPSQQESLTVRNRGNQDITFTINGVDYTVNPGKEQSVTAFFYSFSIKSASGIQQFIARSWYDDKPNESPSKKIVFIGDSITEGYDPQTRSYPLWFNTFTNLAHTVINKGASGNVTSQMLARFDTDVISQKPTHVLINGGKNNVTNADPLTNIQNDIMAMVNKALLAGTTPILSTVIQYGNLAGGTYTYTTTQQSGIVALNNWITEYARKAGLQLIDFYTPMLDSTSGWSKVEYLTNDNLHPSVLGMQIMASVIAPLFERFTLGSISVDSSKNLVKNWDLSIDSNADGVPDNFTKLTSSSPAFTMTNSLVNHPLGGKLCKSVVTTADTTGGYAMVVQAMTGLSPGDTVKVSMDLMIEGVTTGATPDVTTGAFARLRELSSGTTSTLITALMEPFGLRRFTVDFTVPATITTIQLEVGFTKAQGTIYFGRPEVKKK